MPIEVVQAIILRGDPGLERVLVVKERGVRSRKLPGGTVNSGEDYITALQRELSEELSGVEIIRIHPKPQIEEKYVKKLGDTLRMRRYRVDISERSNPRPNNQYGEINKQARRRTRCQRTNNDKIIYFYCIQWVESHSGAGIW